MKFDFTPYVLAQAASALISLSAAVVAWRRRTAPGGTIFALMMTAVSIWTAGVTLEESSVGIPVKIVLSKMSYLGAVNAAPFFLLFAWNFRHGDRAARLPVVLLLWVIPAAALGLAASNE